jgi:ribosomal protein S18 acetylase RimI-like enzyme
MNTQFRRAIIPEEIRSLLIFDRKAFRDYRADWFGRDDWKVYDSWWMIVDGRKVGCSAFEHHVDFQGDVSGENLRLKASLYIATTGILPELRGLGFGNLLKCWQIVYARHHHFTRIVTNTRQSNKAMIRLNEKVGFKVIRSTPNYYDRPREATIVMELRL